MQEKGALCALEKERHCVETSLSNHPNTQHPKSKQPKEKGTLTSFNEGFLTSTLFQLPNLYSQRDAAAEIDVNNTNPIYEVGKKHKQNISSTTTKDE